MRPRPAPRPCAVRTPTHAVLVTPRPHCGRRPPLPPAAAAAGVAEAAFSAATVAAVAAYAAVAGRPRGRLATWLTCSPLVPALGAAAYLGVIALCVPGAAAAAARAAIAAAAPLPSVSAFAALFATPGATAAAWLHLLTLDFVQAAWVARDAAARAARAGARAPPLPVAHSLVLCFMAGPLGLLSHVATRAVWRWRVQGKGVAVG